MRESEELLRVIQDDGGPESVEQVQLDEGQLLRIYRLMQLSRAIDKKCLALQRQGRISFYGTCVGQEAAFVGCTFVLHESDWLFPHYRGQAAALTKGITTEEIFNELFANSSDRAKGRQLPLFFANRPVNFVTASSPVGNMITQGVGAAIAMRLRKTKNVTMVHFGEGATSTGEFNAGMNLAGVFKPPAVLVCVNNQYAISTPLHRQTASKTITIKRRAYGFQGVRVDGNDVLAVYQAAKKAVDFARAGNGPTLIEALTYRLEGHSTSDDPSRYRSKDEVRAWADRDPLIKFGSFLQRQGIWNESKEKAQLTEIEREVEIAVEKAEQTPPPPVASIVEDVFADLPWHLQEQLGQVLRTSTSEFESKDPTQRT